MRRTLATLTAVAAVASVATAVTSSAAAPAPRCPTITDAGGDTTTWLVPVGPVNVPLSRNPDADLDLRAASLRTTVTNSGARRLLAVLSVAKLTPSGPAQGSGHGFDLTFAAAGRTWRLRAADYSGTVESLGMATDGFSLDVQDAGGAWTTTTAPVAGGFAYSTSTVVFDVALTELTKVSGVAVGDGTILSQLTATSYAGFTTGAAKVDTAQAANVADRTYAIGDNRCFGPPAATLIAAGTARGAYGDPTRVAARLRDAAGRGLVGRTVTFTLGTAKASAKTDGTGFASAVLAVRPQAGLHRLVASFAGDTTAGATSLVRDFLVVEEGTRLRLTKTSPTSDMRKVVAQLVDDDMTPHPIVSARIDFYVDGQLTTSKDTDAYGKAQLVTTPGHAVEVRYDGIPGRYAPVVITTTV